MNKPDDHDLTHILWRIKSSKDHAKWSVEWKVSWLMYFAIVSVGIIAYWICKQLL